MTVATTKEIKLVLIGVGIDRSRAPELHRLAGQRWMWNVGVVLIGLAGALLLIRGTKHGPTLTAVAAALFLTGWVFSVLLSPGSFADAISGYHQSVMTLGNGLERARYLIIEMLLPIVQAGLLFIVVAIWLSRRPPPTLPS